MTLYKNFLLKRGVGLFLRVGLISGDCGTMIESSLSRVVLYMLCTFCVLCASGFG